MSIQKTKSLRSSSFYQRWERIYDEDRRKVVGDRYIMSETEVLNVMRNNGYEVAFIDQLFRDQSVCSG